MLKAFSEDSGLKEIDTVRAEDQMDDGSMIKLAVTINRQEGSAVFDFEGELCLSLLLSPWQLILADEWTCSCCHPTLTSASVLWICSNWCCQSLSTSGVHAQDFSSFRHRNHGLGKKDMVRVSEYPHHVHDLGMG